MLDAFWGSEPSFLGSCWAHVLVNWGIRERVLAHSGHIFVDFELQERLLALGEPSWSLDLQLLDPFGVHLRTQFRAKKQL